MVPPILPGTWPLPTGAGPRSPTSPLWLSPALGQSDNIPSPPAHPVEASVSENLVCRITFNPHNYLAVGPSDLSFAAVGVALRLRGLLWLTRLVPGPALCQDFAANHGPLPAPLPAPSWPSWGDGGSCALQRVSAELRMGLRDGHGLDSPGRLGRTRVCPS